MAILHSYVSLPEGITNKNHSEIGVIGTNWTQRRTGAPPWSHLSPSLFLGVHQRNHLPRQIVQKHRAGFLRHRVPGPGLLAVIMDLWLNSLWKKTTNVRDTLGYLGISRSRHIWGWAYSGISWKIWCFQTIPDINCPTISGIYWDILDIGIFVQAYDSNRLKPSWVLNGLVPAMPKIFDPPFCCSIQPAKWSCDVVCFTLW